MSIGGIMRTSVSGMNAQATRLSTVSENIANSDTTGYKQSQTEFSSLVLPPSGAGYNSGSVETQVRTLISQQGGLTHTGNDNNAKRLDLAVDGNGFFAVNDGRGTYLTRAGAFTQQADGTLVNAAGYTLMGYPVGASGTDFVLNGFVGLQEVNLKASLLSANPTTKGILTVPLDKSKTAAGAAVGNATQAADLGTVAGTDTLSFVVNIDGTPHSVSVAGGGTPKTPADIVAAINTAVGGSPAVASLNGNKLVLTSNGTAQGSKSSVALSSVTVNGTASTFPGLSPVTAPNGVGVDKPSFNQTAPIAGDPSTISTSLTVYNNSGEPVKLDIYYTKTADETWEVSVFDSRKASTGTPTSPFPYGASGSAPLATATMNFDPTKYTLSSITAGTNTASPGGGILSIDLGGIDGGNFNLDLGDTTQFTGNTQPLAASVDGNPAEVISTVRVGNDGTITATFASGTTRDLFKIPLALVASPDSMTALAGNVYSPGVESGTVLMGFGGSDGFGDLTAGALEDSTVDLASELTTMITAQRSYTANSKVFQTGSEILDVLVNLKR